MAQVTVTIDGKAYRMACEEGQEDHLSGLAARFDRYVGHLKSQFGEIGDLRITVMAGIMVMDELSELSRKEAEVRTLNSAQAGVLEDRHQNEQVLVSTLDELTGRLASLTAKLTGRPASIN